MSRHAATESDHWYYARSDPRQPSTSFLSSTPTGVVFDPSVSPRSFTRFHPGQRDHRIQSGHRRHANDQGWHQSQRHCLQFPDRHILTVNSLSNTISIVDSQTFATKATLGIGATSKFAAAIQTFTNLAVIGRSGQQPGDSVPVAEVSGRTGRALYAGAVLLPEL